MSDLEARNTVISENTVVFSHKPVLLQEVLDGLSPERQGVFLDLTTGGAGHSLAILELLEAGSELICVDQDKEALKASQLRLTELASSKGVQLRFIHSNFQDLKFFSEKYNLPKFDGILADLGVSSHQLDLASRGFSYMQEAPLDMRMDQSQGRTAADLVNTESEESLQWILKNYGEERYSKRIAEVIVKRRAVCAFTDTQDLVKTIRNALPRKALQEAQHPAKRSFQALRIAVNGELSALETLLEDAPLLLAPEGRLAIISFHSLEDRLVKQAFKSLENPCDCIKSLPCICGKKPVGSALYKKPITASIEELEENPRARSAKLRVFIKMK